MSRVPVWQIVTVELAFRARMSDASLLPELLAADALSAELKTYVRKRLPTNGK